MKPEQFIREFGLEKAREVVAGGADSFTFVLNDGIRSRHKSVSVQSLKRLVESVDLVNSLGGLKAARSEAHKDCFAYNQPLLAAIAAYESIYGGGDE